MPAQAESWAGRAAGSVKCISILLVCYKAQLVFVFCRIYHSGLKYEVVLWNFWN
jgi:hypothetical protein